MGRAWARWLTGAGKVVASSVQRDGRSEDHLHSQIRCASRGCLSLVCQGRMGSVEFPRAPSTVVGLNLTVAVLS